MRELITATVAALSLSTAPVTDGWTWPVDDPAPHVVHAFDPPDEPWSAGHRGVDLAADPGSTVRAAGAGTVSYAGQIGGVAAVTVSHGVVRTTYQAVAPSVAVGQRVEIGQPIGVLTLVGSHCRPHTCLHWGLIQGSIYLDPLRLLGTASPPRLLPLGPKALTSRVRADLGGPAPRDIPPDVAVGRGITARAATGALAGINS